MESHGILTGHKCTNPGFETPVWNGKTNHLNEPGNYRELRETGPSTAKAEKMREFVEVQSYVLETKSPAEVWRDAAERGCVISLGYCISPLYPKHMVHLLRYGLVSQEWII